MKIAANLLPSDPPPVPKVAVWARPRGEVLRDVDAAYLVGSALNSLDNLVCGDVSWAGVWRQRLALKSAAAAVQLLGRPEDESALRDTLLLRAPGDEPGPAGRILSAWRRLAGRTTRLDAEAVRAVADELEVKWDDDLRGIIDNAEDLVTSGRPAPVLAAEIAAELYRARPDAELLACWLADLVLAEKFRWPVPVPLLISQAAPTAMIATIAPREAATRPARIFVVGTRRNSEAKTIGTISSRTASDPFTTVPVTRNPAPSTAATFQIHCEFFPFPSRLDCIDAAVATARRQGFKMARLEARPSDNGISPQALVDMYRRQGFKSVGRTGRGSPLMERKLR